MSEVVFWGELEIDIKRLPYHENPWYGTTTATCGKCDTRLEVQIDGDDIPKIRKELKLRGWSMRKLTKSEEEKSCYPVVNKGFFPHPAFKIICPAHRKIK